ncbi:MAG: hypothetical protein QW468_04820 [Candidatus Bathyarchaeia archaeon]
MRVKTFNKILLEAIDEAFASLGDSAKKAIYFHLESKFKISKDEIPDNINAFADGLEKIFGAGAKFLEILIMKKLYGRIGEPLEWNTNKELEFVDYVKAAKRTFAKRKNSEVNVTKFIETEVE